MDARFLVQAAHLTVPATRWKMIEGACTRSAADLVMLDLEDSIPRGDLAALELGRAQIVRALETLDWGRRLRFFRPRGALLDPGLEDVRAVVGAVGARLDGLVYPKVDSPEEVRRLCEALEEAERAGGIPEGHVKLEVLVESARAEEAAFEIAASSPRIVGLVFGAFDYWSSLGALVPYRFDHPLAVSARMRIVKAAASIGAPAIAEMTLNYPTKDKDEAGRRSALEECRRDAIFAKDLGFSGKWTGIPAQTEIVREVFALDPAEVERAAARVRSFIEAERQGLGAVMIGGLMIDRAADRVDRTLLRAAHLQGLLDPAEARALGVD